MHRWHVQLICRGAEIGQWGNHSVETSETQDKLYDTHIYQPHQGTETWQHFKNIMEKWKLNDKFILITELFFKFLHLRNSWFQNWHADQLKRPVRLSQMGIVAGLKSQIEQHLWLYTCDRMLREAGREVKSYLADIKVSGWEQGLLLFLLLLSLLAWLSWDLNSYCPSQSPNKNRTINSHGLRPWLRRGVGLRKYNGTKADLILGSNKEEIPLILAAMLCATWGVQSLSQASQASSHF